MEGRRAIRARNISKKFTCSSQLLPRFTDHEKFGVTRAEEDIIFQWHEEASCCPLFRGEGYSFTRGTRIIHVNRPPLRNKLETISSRDLESLRFRACSWDFRERDASVFRRNSKHGENSKRNAPPFWRTLLARKIIDKFFQSKLEQNLIRDGVQCIPRDIFHSMLTM